MPFEISDFDRQRWDLVDVPPIGTTTALACPGANVIEVDAWERTPEADHLRSVRIHECAMGLRTAAIALGIDVLTMGALERAQVRPRDPRLFALMTEMIRKAAAPPPIPDGL